MKRSAILTLPIAGLLGQRAFAGAPLRVVAAENVWGSVVAQLGGSRVAVTSVVTDPNADPHDYEANVLTARAFAEARYIVLNGAGYDAWAEHLVAGDTSRVRTVLTVAELVHAAPGSNPHFWYNPTYVERAADRIASDLMRIDPAGAAYYRSRRAAFRSALQPYHARIRAIRALAAGATVGATETIFVYLADALGLRLISPPAFMNAINDGTEPPVEAVVTMTRQISERRIRMLAYNLQTVTSVTTNLRRVAEEHRVAVVGITETIVPPGATFQQWQTRQLDDILAALRRPA
jgi:zinc/manganese transport system substrate-binding protein